MLCLSVAASATGQGQYYRLTVTLLNVSVDASATGQGQLEIDSDLPIREYKTIGERVYNIQYVPKKTGKHDLMVKYNGIIVDGNDKYFLPLTHRCPIKIRKKELFANLYAGTHARLASERNIVCTVCVCITYCCSIVSFVTQEHSFWSNLCCHDKL